MEEGEETVKETRVMELFRSKWALSSLVALEDGDLRFNELKRTVGSAPSNTLSDRLSELEEENLVSRTVEDGAPPRVTYSLTPRGRKVVEVIVKIDQL